jgi:hypothetical protein
MKTLQLILSAIVASSLLFSTTCDARGKDKSMCACGMDFIDSIVELSCVDSYGFSKKSQGKGYFDASLGWTSMGECVSLISAGMVNASTCKVTQPGTVDGAGFCDFNGLAIDKEVASREEGRVCITMLREIDRYLGTLPTCEP